MGIVVRVGYMDDSLGGGSGTRAGDSSLGNWVGLGTEYGSLGVITRLGTGDNVPSARTETGE